MSSNIPKSFETAGFYKPNQPKKRRRLMIGTEGVTDSGKTEFLLSAPGPGIIIAVDPTYEAALDNPKPPSSRRGNHIFYDIKIPMSQMGTGSLGPALHGKYKDLQEMAKDYWNEFRNKVYEACAIEDALTVSIDGDSDTWNLQKLVDFGRIELILPRSTGPMKDTRRVFIYKMFHTGKNIVATNKLKAKYVPVLDENGNTKRDKDGEIVKEPSPTEVERQGYPADLQDYLWQFQIRHLIKKPEIIRPETRRIATIGINKGKEIVTPAVVSPAQWGLRILKCKHNVDFEGAELWGDQCNYGGLVALTFPNSDPSEWGL